MEEGLHSGATRCRLRPRCSRQEWLLPLLALALSLVLSALCPCQAQTTAMSGTSQTAMDAFAAAMPPSTACPQIWSKTCGNKKLCDSSGNIKQINAQSCGLSGSIPSQVSLLQSLQSLNLQKNSVTGFASQLSSVTNLVTLLLGDNAITGSIPTWLVAMPKLNSINLGNNKLTGCIPTSYSSSVNTFNVSLNSLSGSVPSNISAPGLGTLVLNGNQFSGALPSFGSAPILTLYLSNNKFSNLANLGSYPRLQNLYADNNQLTTPPEAGSANVIQNIYLQNNIMAGSIPSSWSYLTSVAYLDISNNNLSGSIPGFLFTLNALNQLSLNGNYFSGNVPDTYCNFNPTVILANNCLSYSTTFNCPTAEAMRGGDECQQFCGEQCVPTLPGVDKTSAPLGGCLDCPSQGVYWQFDAASGVGTTSSLDPGVTGSPSRNIQKYLTVGAPTGPGTVIGTSTATDWVSCCQDCAKASGCSFWHFYPPENGAVPTSQGGQAGAYCYLLSVAPPLAMLPVIQLVDTTVPVSQVGGKCNPAAQVVDDPHFVGARGTRFDFSGDLDHSFCLLSDATVHINVLLRGYLDSRLEEATKIVNGKAVRSWIKETTILWRSPSGKVASLRFGARSGVVDDSAAHTFLEKLVVSGSATRPPKMGMDLPLGDGMSLAFRGVGERGRSKVAKYELHLGDETVIGIHLRPAHKKLQTESDSQVHINIHLLKIKTTGSVHGILGQTFREERDRIRRAQLFSDISRVIRGPVAVDAVTGRGFLDGTPGDYATSRLDSPDCAFAHKAWRHAAWRHAAVQ